MANQPNVVSSHPEKQNIKKENITSKEIYEMLKKARFGEEPEEYVGQFDDGNHRGEYDIYDKEQEMGDIDFNNLPLQEKYIKSIGKICGLQGIDLQNKTIKEVLEILLNTVSIEDINAIQISCDEGIQQLQEFITTKQSEYIAQCIAFLDESIAKNGDNPRILTLLKEKKAYLQQLTTEYAQARKAYLEGIKQEIQTYKEFVDLLAKQSTGKIKNALITIKEGIENPIQTNKRNNNIAKIVNHITKYDVLETGAIPYAEFTYNKYTLGEELAHVGDLLGREKGSEEIKQLGRIQTEYQKETQPQRKLGFYKDANKELMRILSFLTATKTKQQIKDEDLKKITEEMSVDTFLQTEPSEKYPVETQLLLASKYYEKVEQEKTNQINALEKSKGLLKNNKKIDEEIQNTRETMDVRIRKLTEKKANLIKINKKFDEYQQQKKIIPMYAEFGLLDNVA